MKLRIDGNALRLRLSRSEVARFGESGYIEDAIDFGPMGKFTYSVTCYENSTVLSTYTPSKILIKVPRDLAQAWASTDRVGISAVQTLDGDSSLQILIEKDFQCLHKDTAPDADAYPNPLASTDE